MRLFRVGLPALIGLLLLFIAVQSTITGLGPYGDGPIRAFLAGLAPAAVGAAFVLAALAMSRRSRIGYLAGLAVGATLVLGGVAIVVIELGYVDEGGFTGSIASGIIVVGTVWTLLSLLYLWAVRRDRAAFASTWGPIDRRFGIVFGGLAAFSVAAAVALSVISAGADTAASVDEAKAQELVNGTAIQVHVIDASFVTLLDGTSSQVSHLTLEVRIQGAEAYALAVSPTVCLTDQATHLDPAYKTDLVCWGTSGAAIPIVEINDLMIPVEERSIRLEVDRDGSRCGFGAGAWNAEFTLTPLLSTPGRAGPAPAQYRVDVGFDVGSTVGPPPSGTAEASKCFDQFVSP